MIARPLRHLLLCLAVWLTLTVGARAQTTLFVSIDNVEQAGTTLEFDVLVQASEAGTKLGATQIYLDYNDAAFLPSSVAASRISATKGSLIASANYQNGNPAVLVVPTPLLHDNQPLVAAISVDFSGTCEEANTVPGPTDSPAQLLHVTMTMLSSSSVPQVALRAPVEQPSMKGQQFECDNQAQYEVVIKTTNALYAGITVFMQGPFSSGSMSTALKAGGDVPLTQPFGVAPWNYAGAENVTSIPANVVDWVLVELRTGVPSAPQTVAARKAGFLLNNGKIVPESGDPNLPLEFTGAAPGNYYVAVFHRNHLAIVSSSALDFNDGEEQYNFTTAAAQAYGSGAMRALGGGVYGMWAADGSADRQVTAPDFNLYLAQTTAGATGYKSADYNMDGQVTAPDFNLYLANTTAGAKSGVPLP